MFFVLICKAIIATRTVSTVQYRPAGPAGPAGTQDRGAEDSIYEDVSLFFSFSKNTKHKILINCTS